jgi:hypothetical protein
VAQLFRLSGSRHYRNGGSAAACISFDDFDFRFADFHSSGIAISLQRNIHLPELCKASGNIDQAEPENISKRFLRQIFQIIGSAVFTDQEQIEQVAELHKRIIVFLMAGFIQEKVRTGGEPVNDVMTQKRVSLKHSGKLFLCNIVA